MLVDGPHFQATNGGELVFLLSDGDTSRRPGEHDILELEEESGTVRRNYYLRIPLEHPDSQRWRTEIAKYLAPLVLGSAYNSLPPYHNARIPIRALLMAHFRMSSLLHSHSTYDSHDGSPTLDSRRLPTRIHPTFALIATQDPVLQTPSRLFTLRCASSPFPIRGRLMHAYMYE